MPDHFNVLAPIYDLVIPPSDPAQLRERLRLPTAGRLLDAGGGTGRVSSRIRQLVGELVISDLSRPMLNQARAKGLTCPVLGHAECLPFPSGSFERVLVVDAFHHFCDQRAALTDLLRVLKPDGRLVIEEPDIQRLAVKFVAVAEKLALMRSHFYSARQIQQMVVSHGLQAKIETDGLFTAWIMVDK
jgi:ubiquinone/menaquinone biosynthesis C-methylase UbiE